jgi:hypothetical protein
VLRQVEPEQLFGLKIAVNFSKVNWTKLLQIPLFFTNFPRCSEYNFKIK